MDFHKQKKNTNSVAVMNSFFEKINKKKILTGEEWNKVHYYLFHGTHEERDNAALVLMNRIAVSIVSKVLSMHRISDTLFDANWHTPDTYRDDLINEAWSEAYIRAKTFDPGKNASLQSYLYKYVYGVVQKAFYSTVMQGQKPHYKKDEKTGRYHVEITSTQSLSQKVRMKNKDTNRKMEDLITGDAEDIRRNVINNPDKLVKLIVYARKELTEPLFHMFVLYLRGERSTIDLSKLNIISRQRFYTILKKIKRDFSGRESK